MLSLVDDAHQWKKWWSMRFIILTTFLNAVTVAYATLPYDWMPSIPDWVKQALAAGALLTAGAAGVARVVSQQGLRDDKCKQETPDA